MVSTLQYSTLPYMRMKGSRKFVKVPTLPTLGTLLRYTSPTLLEPKADHANLNLS